MISNQQVLVPLYDKDTENEHGMKYLILNEEPTEYICSKGCVHKYPPKRSLELPKNTTGFEKELFTMKDVIKKHNSAPVYKYYGSGKVQLLKDYIGNNVRALSVEKGVVNQRSSPFPSTNGIVMTANEVINQTEPIDDGYSLIENKPSSSYETKQLQANNIIDKSQLKDYDTSISDVFERLYPYRKGVPYSLDAGSRIIGRIRMDWKNYHRLETIYNFMEDLEQNFPSLCTVGTIGKSVEGRDLKILKISNGDAKNSAVWIDSGIHAREWIGPAVSTFIADYITRNFDNLPKSVKNKDWYFMPVVNADGYEYSHTKYRMWRKNRATVGNKCCGVDINRNFSVAWGGKGSSSDPEHSFFRGPSPFSEPEACAMKEVLKNANLPFKVYLTLHAYGEVIIMPFAHSDELCNDYIRLLGGAVVMSRAIYDTDGTIYRVGVSKDVMYKASGTSNDWCFGAAGIPWCYLLELRSKKHRFKCPEEEIKETSQEILNGVLALMEHVDKVPLDLNAGDCRPLRSASTKQKFAKVDPATESEKKPTQVWELRLVNEGCRQFIRALDTAGVVNIWREEPKSMEVMVCGPKITQVHGLFNQREIPYTLAIEDVDALIERQCRCTYDVVSSAGSHLTSRKSRGHAMNWQNYHDLETISQFLEDIATDYYFLVKLFTIGVTAEGRRILAVKISNGNTSNSGVWIDGGIHAREWISVASVTYFINSLVGTFQDQPACVTSKDWYIVPVLNPDGYVHTRKVDRMWRKNRARYGGSVGVDLNRNFSHGWGENGEEGSSGEPGSMFFRGPQPFSEAESSAVRKAIERATCQFKVFISIHSFGEVIIFPWGYKDEACPTYVELLEGGTVMAKAINETSGHTYKVGSTKDLMYYASGTSIDWSYGTKGIPYSYMIELPGKKHKFLLPPEEIIPTANDVYKALLRLVEFVDYRSVGTQSRPRSRL